jgi:hypothetical protein
MITESWAIYNIILLFHWVIYIFAPMLLFWAGWPIAGGLAMIIASFMPLLGQVWFTDSDAPGLGILLMLEFPPACIVTLVGIGISIARLIERLRDPTEPLSP